MTATALAPQSCATPDLSPWLLKGEVQSGVHTWGKGHFWVYTGDTPALSRPEKASSCGGPSFDNVPMVTMLSSTFLSGFLSIPCVQIHLSINKQFSTPNQIRVVTQQQSHIHLYSPRHQTPRADAVSFADNKLVMLFCLVLGLLCWKYTSNSVEHKLARWKRLSC